MSEGEPTVDAEALAALHAFCEVGCRELGRVPLDIPEEVETLSGHDIAFVRWGLRLLERDATFHALVAAVDAAYLDAHRTVMGQAHEPSDLDGNEKPVVLNSLEQHVRCFLRRRVYRHWLEKKDVDVAKLGASLVKAIHDGKVRVHTLVWMEGVHRPDRSELPFGANARLVGFDGNFRKGIVSEIRNLRLFFLDALPFSPEHLEEVEFVHFVEQREPAAVLAEVGAYGPSNFRVHVNFTAGREAFPRRGWKLDLERRLDGLRLINWQPFHHDVSVSGYTPPVLRTALALHESPLFQPFELHHARESLRDTEFVGPRGEEVEHPAYWLFLEEPMFKATFQLAADLGELREKVSSDVHGWTFIDQAFEYLRRSEDAEGYEQFVMLTAVVDCLLSKGKAGAKDFENFIRRWAWMARPTGADDLQSQIERNETLYELRSRYVHGDLERDAVIGVSDLNTMNVNARTVLRRVLRWLAAIRQGGHTQMPSKKGLLQYLDVVANTTPSDAALADVVDRFPGLRSSPADLAAL